MRRLSLRSRPLREAFPASPAVFAAVLETTTGELNRRYKFPSFGR
jgi:hypothetical protein